MKKRYFNKHEVSVFLNALYDCSKFEDPEDIVCALRVIPKDHGYFWSLFHENYRVDKIKYFYLKWHTCDISKTSILTNERADYNALLCQWEQLFYENRLS